MSHQEESPLHYEYRCGCCNRPAPSGDIYGWVPSRKLVLLCPECGKDEPLWGPGTAENLAAQIPLPRGVPEPEDPEIRRGLDRLFHT
jgi:hypothetical protein